MADSLRATLVRPLLGVPASAPPRSLHAASLATPLEAGGPSDTYNRRVNSIPPVAQHVMLLKALENGLTEERIARSLCVDISVIRRKRDLLKGICEEAVDLLQTRKEAGTSSPFSRK